MRNLFCLCLMLAIICQFSTTAGLAGAALVAWLASTLPASIRRERDRRNGL